MNWDFILGYISGIIVMMVIALLHEKKLKKDLTISQKCDTI